MIFLKKNEKSKFSFSWILVTNSMKNPRKSPEILYIQVSNFFVGVVKISESQKKLNFRKIHVKCRNFCDRPKIRGSSLLGQKLIARLTFEIHLFKILKGEIDEKSPEILYIQVSNSNLTRAKIFKIEKFQKIQKFHVICKNSCDRPKIRGSSLLGEKLVARLVFEIHLFKIP